MSKINFDSDTLFSAVKRKNVKDILVYMLGEAGETGAMEILKEKTRITDAAILEVRNALGTTDDKATVVEDEVIEDAEAGSDATDLTYADNIEAECDALTIGDIKALVATGKKKKIAKAKEAFKSQFGKDHPNYKELKKLFKKEK